MKLWIEKFETFMMKDDLSDADIFTVLVVLSITAGGMAYLLSP